MYKQTALYIINCSTKSPHYKNWHAGSATASYISPVTLEQVQLNSYAVLQIQLLWLHCNTNMAAFTSTIIFYSLKGSKCKKLCTLRTTIPTFTPKGRTSWAKSLSILAQMTGKIANCSVVWFLIAVCLSELTGQWPCLKAVRQSFSTLLLGWKK